LVQLGSVLERYDDATIKAATDECDGIQAHCKFPPSIAECREFCDEIRRRQNRTADWDARAQKQFREREEMERDYARETPEHRRAVAQRIKAEIEKARLNPPPNSYTAMVAKYGRPIGPFEPEHSLNRAVEKKTDEQIRAEDEKKLEAYRQAAQRPETQEKT
jgi:hypothetical protein